MFECTQVDMGLIFRHLTGSSPRRALAFQSRYAGGGRPCAGFDARGLVLRVMDRLGGVVWCLSLFRNRANNVLET